MRIPIRTLPTFRLSDLSESGRSEYLSEGRSGEFRVMCLCVRYTAGALAVVLSLVAVSAKSSSSILLAKSGAGGGGDRWEVAHRATSEVISGDHSRPVMGNATPTTTGDHGGESPRWVREVKKGACVCSTAVNVLMAGHPAPCTKISSPP